ncbi:MAG: CoA transferase [SAR324 cluster bacterium]|nr:CoA transferase [SAR324 cluster bacterium]
MTQTSQKSQSTLPLRGVRVLDFTQNLPGPYATFLLACLGAEVIKVEPPRGDGARALPPFFEMVNRGKKSMTVDLNRPEDREILCSLVSRMDVVVEGFRPGVMQKFGLNGSALLEINPRLIYCSISGYGQTGPLSETPGHDLNFQAFSGMCHMQRDASGIPQPVAIPMADLSSSMSAVSAILAALYAREKEFIGRIIDIAMTDTIFSWVWIWYQGLHPQNASAKQGIASAENWLDSQKKGVLHRLRPLLSSPSLKNSLEHLEQKIQHSSFIKELERLRLHILPHYNLYRTKDGHYLSIGIVDEEKFWKILCKELNLNAFLAVPLPARGVLAWPLRRQIRQRIAKKTLEEWTQKLFSADLPVYPVIRPDEAAKNLQRDRNSVMENGILGSPFSLGQCPHSPAPGLGEHNEEILASLLIPEK